MTYLLLQVVQHAQNAHVAKAGQPPEPAMFVPDHWPVQAELLNWAQALGPGLATLMVVMGIVYLLFGHNIFKWLILLNSAILGALVGAFIGEHTGGSVPLAITCAFIFAVVTWPMVKWAVAVTGAVYGAAIGVSLWGTAGMDPNFAWTGAIMGLIFFGLLTFILFRSCVMTFMSLQGAAMIIFGTLSLTSKYDGMMIHRIASMLASKPFLLPMIVFIKSVLGVVFQHHSGKAAPPPAKK